jgi:hypothetical protein
MTKDFKPACILANKAVALTNKGELIPCCHFDTVKGRADPGIKAIYKINKIDDYDNIEEILYQQEWIDFYNNLINNNPCDTCIKVCSLSGDQKANTRLEISYK